MKIHKLQSQFAGRMSRSTCGFRHHATHLNSTEKGENLMADQELRDKTNHLLGKIKTLSNGKLELRDATNHLKGTYDPKTNETRDPTNHLVGKGNLLTSLLR